ncbi:Geminin [Acropora cervicornis]|uniref:Geminin n=1 Tax=Acropora cervicornis TaxID=6130 RepID=A0AAD9R7M9_ACRCE|nr:Geminin [Acropora cervicornis]
MSLNSNEVDSPVALQIDSEAFRIKFINDENSPISSGEIRTMRNHPKVTAGVFSPSRKSRGDSKIKPKSFSSGLYSSPSAKTTSQKLVVDREKRKTLQVLQPAASGDGTLVGNRVVVRKNERKQTKTNTPVSRLKQQKLKVQDSDSSTSTRCSDSSDSDSAKKSVRKNIKPLQNDLNDRALMISETPPERYWELLAEERRLALQNALEENERLHKELEELKERNKALEEVAGQAEYFASLYQMVMEGEVPDEQSSDEAEKSEIR